MRTRRRLLAVISFACTLLVFLLFSFPNYCDNCAYRNITLYAYSLAPERLPPGSSCGVPSDDIPSRRLPCCPAPDRERDAGPGTDEEGGAALRHARVPYCLSYTISSISGSTVLFEAARGGPVSATLRVTDPEFSRLTVALDHKECRAPPA